MQGLLVFFKNGQQGVAQIVMLILLYSFAQGSYKRKVSR